MTADPRSSAQRRRDTEHRLTHDKDVWVARASADGAPYLVPLSVDWDGEALLMATPTDGPTGRNLAATPAVRLGLGHTRDVSMRRSRGPRDRRAAAGGAVMTGCAGPSAAVASAGVTLQGTFQDRFDDSVSALADAYGGVTATVRDLAEPDLLRPTRCVGWTVAHLGGQIRLRGGAAARRGRTRPDRRAAGRR